MSKGVIGRLGITVERVNWFWTYHVHHRVADRSSPHVPHGLPDRGELFVLASEARDLALQHAATLESAGVRVSSLSRHRGEAYLEPFGRALRDLAQFLDSVV